jgi:hypothetical protein
MPPKEESVKELQDITGWDEAQATRFLQSKKMAYRQAEIRLPSKTAIPVLQRLTQLGLIAKPVIVEFYVPIEDAEAFDKATADVLNELGGNVHYLKDAGKPASATSSEN